MQRFAMMICVTLSSKCAHCDAMGGNPCENGAQQMDINLTTFEDTMGACERIKKTPLPVAFVVHMRFASLSPISSPPFPLPP